VEQWEYLFVAAYASRGTHRVQRANGHQLEQWEDGPTLYDYCQDLGDEGWELVGANTVLFPGF
jgi:hypothetical protein